MALAGGIRHSTCVLRCCGAYFSLDAAPLTAVNSGSLPPPPVFEIFTFQSVKHTGIGAHFQVKILEIWVRIRHINETNLGAFQSKLWPVPNQGGEKHGTRSNARAKTSGPWAVCTGKSN